MPFATKKRDHRPDLSQVASWERAPKVPVNLFGSTTNYANKQQQQQQKEKIWQENVTAFCAEIFENT